MRSAEWVGIDADEIRDLAAEAVVFGLPLIMTDLVRRVHPAPNARFLRWSCDPGMAATPAFSHDPDLTASSAWVDLTDGPVVVTLPDMHGRHAAITVHDAWGGRLASLGSRVTGGIGRDVAIVGPDWRGELACGLSAVRSSTDGAWITSAIWAHGAADRERARTLDQRLFLTPLFGPALGGARSSPVMLPAARPIREDLSGLGAVPFLHRLAGLLAEHPPARCDLARLATLARLGVFPGRPFDGLDLSSKQLAALDLGMAEALDRVRKAAARTGAGLRATVKVSGGAESAEDRAARLWNTLGAPPCEDVSTWIADTDEAGRPLDGARRYRILFEADRAPPAEAFWTVDLLDADGRQVTPDYGRAAVSDRGQPVWDQGGGLNIPIQNRRPSREAGNWLAAPKGRFAIRLQMHWPRASVLDGRWSPPQVVDLGPARAPSTVFNAGTHRRARSWSLSGGPSALSLNGALS